MAKREKELHAGIDIGSKILNVALRLLTGEVKDLTFDNTSDGRRKLVSLLTKGGRPARVVLEATSLYGLDLCLALDDAEVQVMVVNPRAARRFAEAQMLRAKTDRVDSRMLLEFLRRMEFVSWTRPSTARLTVRMYARRIADLVKQQTAEKNRLHALRATSATPVAILEDLEAGLANLNERIEALTTAAETFIKDDAELAPLYQALDDVKGVGPTSAIAILGELLLLPSDMTCREVVAHAGLDPRPKETGGPKMGVRSISKIGNSHLRGALWMPAMTAAVHNPAVKAHYGALVARGKLRMVAMTAVCRKLLQVFWRMLQTKEAFDPARFSANYSTPIP